MNHFSSLSILFGLLSCSALMAQTPEDPRDNDGGDVDFFSCNSDIQGTCLKTITKSPATGEVGNDDGEDFFLFPIGQGNTLTFTFSGNYDVQIYEYTGTAGMMGATLGTQTSLSSGMSFPFDNTKKYALRIVNRSPIFDTKNYSIVISGTLPVQLSYLKAELHQEGVQIAWHTAQEINNDFFEIERSIDAKNFEKIGRVSGNGNTNATHFYEFLDVNPPLGTVYYRLRQVDFGGRFELSRVVATHYTGRGVFKLYPNPVKDYLILELPKNAQAHSIEVIDGLGRVVGQYEPALYLPVDKLVAGRYLFKVYTTDRQIFYQAVSKW
jgi:hypothetical protein